MSSEVCPFCGKTYKRLKSHLPHCKAAAAVNPQSVTEHQSSQPTSPKAARFSEPTAMGKKSPKTVSTVASPQSKKGTKVSAVSSVPSQSLSPAVTSNAASMSPLSLSSSPPPSTKKKKPKLSEQIKKASTPAPPLTSPSPSPSLSLSPILYKKKSLRAQIEAAKLDQVAKGSPEDLPSGSLPLLTDPLRSRATVQTETNMIPDNTSIVAVSTDSKRKDAPQKNVAKTNSAAPSLSTIRDFELNQIDARDKVQVDSTGGYEDSSRNDMVLKSSSALQSRITIQDVKSMLGRAKSSTQSSRARFLCQDDNTENQSGKTRRNPLPSPVTAPPEMQNDAVSCLVTAKTKSELLNSVTSQRAEKLPHVKNSSKSLIPLQHDGSSQPKPTPPAVPFPLSQVSQATPLPRAGSLTEGLKPVHRIPDLMSLSSSPVQFPSRHPFPAASQPLPLWAGTYRDDDALKLKDRKQVTAPNQIEVAVTQRSLGQVRLRELPEWLACKTPRNPRDVVGMMQRGWQWYCRRYIDVKKGGVGGVGMLLVGYCVLSYAWSYPHIKRDRWRKHH